MIVRMLVSISGSRNDSAWPAAGATLELPDDEGQDLIGAGLAVEADSLDAEPEPEPVSEPEEPVAPLEDLKSAAVGYADSEAQATEQETAQETETGGPPKPAASKQDWIDYAVSQGAEWIAATNSTKQQLMEDYGQRPLGPWQRRRVGAGKPPPVLPVRTLNRRS